MLVGSFEFSDQTALGAEGNKYTLSLYYCKGSKEQYQEKSIQRWNKETMFEKYPGTEI